MANPNLFGVDFAGLFASALGGQLHPYTLTIRTPGTTYDPLDPGAGPRHTEATFQCKGICEVKETSPAGEGSLRMLTGSMMILLGTISTPGIRPKKNDVVNFIPAAGLVAQDAYVLEADYDPAGATVTLSLKG